MLRLSIVGAAVALLGACASDDATGTAGSNVDNTDGTPGGANDATATFSDNAKNGRESDVDCGGPGDGPRCAVGKACVEHSDCESNACAFDKKCVPSATCTQLEGGQTCGPEESLTKQNDCCERAKVGTATIDKYLVTAGRMRAFVTRLDGKLRDWAAALPSDKWNQKWTAELPNSIDGTSGDKGNVNSQLGPFYGKRGCESGYHTGHTYWTPAKYDGPGHTGFQDFPQSVLDTKALNCVPWYMLAALCAYDGGHLLKAAELRTAYTNDKTTAYPWGALGDYRTAVLPNWEPSPYAIQQWGYATPNPPANAHKDEDGGFLDVVFYIAAPGRKPKGYNKTGHADLVGNVLEWVGDAEKQYVWKGSFEQHGALADQVTPGANDPYSAINPKTNKPYFWQDVVKGEPDSQNINGYYAVGGRCAY